MAKKVIAVSGVSGSGKSTLIQQLALQYENVHVLEEAPYEDICNFASVPLNKKVWSSIQGYSFDLDRIVFQVGREQTAIGRLSDDGILLIDKPAVVALMYFLTIQARNAKSSDVEWLSGMVGMHGISYTSIVHIVWGMSYWHGKKDPLLERNTTNALTLSLQDLSLLKLTTRLAKHYWPNIKLKFISEHTAHEAIL